MAKLLPPSRIASATSARSLMLTLLVVSILSDHPALAAEPEPGGEATGAIEGSTRDALTGEPVFVPRIDVYDPAGCDVAEGTPVAVMAGQTTGGIDFELVPYGHLSGRLTAAADGAPLEGWISVHDEEGHHLQRTATFGVGGVVGDYTFLDLLPGRYRVSVSEVEEEGLALEAWNDLPCSPLGCHPLAGELVAIEPGLTTGGIDFALEPETALFFDDFESGNPDAWSFSVP